jgi:FG-GAP-like repeat
MSGSSRNTRIAVFAAVAVATAVTIDAGHDKRSAVPGRSPAPNWEHIRSIGGHLGIPRTIRVGAAPSRSLGVGDFDGDGDADIAIGTAAVRHVVVLLGDGSGRFESSVTAARSDWPIVDADAAVDGVSYRAQSSVLSSLTSIQTGANAPRRSRDEAGHFAVVADFNGDVTPDVAAALGGSRDLVVYLGAAAGESSRPQRIPLDATPTSLATGDFDADGIADLIVADTGSTLLTLLYGDGRGGFARRRAVDAGVKAAIGGLAVGYVDADRLADLVVVSDRSDEVKLLLGTRVGGFTLLDRIAVVDSIQSGTAPKNYAHLTAAFATDARSSGVEYQGIASLVLNPATIAGGSGATSTGTITLDAPAPAGGVVVALASSNRELAASIPSLTVPEGATTATFTIGTNQNYRRYSGLAFNVTISATHGATTQSAILHVTAQPRPGTLSNFDAQNEGQMCFGVGVRQVGDSTTLEFGSAGNLFDCVAPDNPVGQDGTCTFRQECSLGCERRPPADGFRFSDVCATTGPFPVAVNPKLLVGGNPSLGTLQLNAPAPASSSGVMSSFTTLANTIPNFSTPIPAGATAANVDVLTARVSSPQFAPIDGNYYTPRSDGSVGGRIGLTWLVLVPGSAPPFRLTSFNFDSSGLTSVVGGTDHVMVAQMNQVAPAPAIATVTMTLSSSHPSVASFAQPEVTFTHGSSNRGVVLQTHAVSADTVVTLSATVGTSTLTREVTVRATPAATRVNSFFLDPFDVPGGTSSTGLVVLNGSAPAGGAVVTLVSANTEVATMPPSVTVPAGSDRVSFAIATRPVSSNTTVTLTANFNGTWTATSLIVTPTPGAASLASLAVSPSSVVGGNASTGTVTLSGPAPAGGAAVGLSSSGSAATVPTSVTVPGGAQSATFGITTSTVTTSTTVTVTGSFAGTSRSATLTVTPSAPQPTPSAPALLSPANGATVSLPLTFDWSDVSGATSYRLQVDDSSSFTSPRVIEQTVTASQFTASSLAVRQHWWRVRGVNSAGTAGAWSSVRSFTPQSAATAAALSSVSVTPTSVVGGSSAQGRVTLTAAAPAGGFTVTLSDNSSAATVPASATVAQGATSATFAISTTAVTASTVVTITASAGGVTRTTTLTVTPQAQTGTVTVTVTATGRSGERVTSSPAGINVAVGSTGSAPFASGTSITLSVSNGRDAIWSGACSSGGNKTRTCTFAPAASATVTANVQ